MTEINLSFSTRRRILLIQLIYALEINFGELFPIDENKLLEIVNNTLIVSRHRARYDKQASDLDVRMLLEITNKLPNLDQIIFDNCNRESRNTISKVVFAILRVGVYELKYGQHQYSISNIIKDYLNIAVAFDHDPESGFINGILDKAYSL
jgi:transcription termination factor NusB